MLLSWLALMLTRDLLVSASHPFQWRFCEADWFIQTTGLETLSQLRDFFNLQGREHSATQLEECLSAAPHLDVRSGSELNLAFWSGWAEFELGVYRTPAPRVNLAAVVPTVPGGSRGAIAGAPSLDSGSCRPSRGGGPCRTVAPFFLGEEASSAGGSHGLCAAGLGFLPQDSESSSANCS